MLRNEWQFDFASTELARAAKKQFIFRSHRVEEWLARKAEVMDAIRKEGISINEAVADQLYSGKYAGKFAATHFARGPQIVIDPTMQQDLNECMDRIRHHAALRDQYAAWMQVLEGTPARRVQLHQDDWMYFFGQPLKDEDTDVELVEPPHEDL